MMKAKNRTPIFTLQFCKDNIVKKWQLRFDVAKAALLRCKTYVFTVQKSRFWNAEQSVLECADDEMIT